VLSGLERGPSCVVRLPRRIRTARWRVARGPLSGRRSGYNIGMPKPIFYWKPT
jgi:hypothetical protein